MASTCEMLGRKKSVIAEANERRTYERVGTLVPVIGVVKLNDSVLYDVICWRKTIQRQVLILNRNVYLQSTRVTAYGPYMTCGEDNGYVLRQHHSLG